MRKWCSFVIGSCVVTCLAISASAGVNVLTYHNNNNRTGANIDETILTPDNVRTNTFGRLFHYDVDGHIYAQPLLVSGLKIPGLGVRNVVFVATQHNSVYAFDADNNTGPNGGLIWHVNLGPSAATPNGDFGNRFGGFTEINPEVGITGTPVIDLASGTLYLDAFTHEGAEYFHRIHALKIVDGSERPFSPVLVQATYPGVGVGSVNGAVVFEAKQQLQRSALTLVNGIVYVAYAAYSITDPYHGWLLGFDAHDLSLSPNYIFNTSPNGTVEEFGEHAGEASIWMGGGGLCADGGNLFFATGNGFFNAFNNSGGTEYGDTLMKLSTSGGLSVDDYFTPFNHQYLADNDLDLGSGAVMLLPNQGGQHPHMLVCAGKEGRVYLVDRDKLTSDNTHCNTTDNVDMVVQHFSLSAGSFSTPAWFDDRIYYAVVGKPMVAFPITKQGFFDTNALTIGPRSFNFPGATPSVSANGARDGIIWAIRRGGPAVLIAHQAGELAEEIYSSDLMPDRDQLPEGVKFAVPTVANGKVYVGTKGGLHVFGLLDTGGGPGDEIDIPAGTYNGLFYEPGGVQRDRSGSFSMKVTSSGAFTGKLSMSTGSHVLKGKFDGNGAATITVARKANSPLTLTLQLDTSDFNHAAGTVSGDGWSADLTANRVAFEGRPASPFAGNYTVIFPGPANGNTQVPQGDGFGAVSVSSKGRVQFKGALADGTKVTQSTWISEEGEWPLYASPPKKQEQILGWVSVADIAQDGVGGQVSWIKSPNSGATFFPNGFSLQLTVLGATYQKPPPKAPMLSFTEAILTLTGGNLTEPISSPITITSQNKVINEGTVKLTLRLDKISGLFTGTVQNPEGGKRIGFSGAILQDQNSGSGYFLGGNQSGQVTLQPR